MSESENKILETAEPSVSKAYFRPRRFKRWLLLRLLGQYADALEAESKHFDGVLDVMDSLVGFCHSRCRLGAR